MISVATVTAIVVAMMTVMAAFRCAVGVMTVIVGGGDDQSANSGTDNSRPNNVNAVSFRSASPKNARCAQNERRDCIGQGWFQQGFSPVCIPP